MFQTVCEMTRITLAEGITGGLIAATPTLIITIEYCDPKSNDSQPLLVTKHVRKQGDQYDTLTSPPIPTESKNNEFIHVVRIAIKGSVNL